MEKGVRSPLPGDNLALGYRLFQAYSSALDWLFPPHCAGCNAPGFHWCPDCRKSVKTLREPLCDRCGKPQTFQGECARCKAQPPDFQMARALGEFQGPLRNAVLHLKYHHDLTLGDLFAQELVHVLKGLAWEIEMVVPVPLAKERHVERGFNQVDSFARPLAWRMDLPLDSDAIWRTRHTVSQVGLSFSERQANVHAAFRARPESVAGKRVLLVDDVMTTGATLDACARALKEAAASEVFALTLARAIESVPAA